MDGEYVGESNGDDLTRYRSEYPRLVAVECTNSGGAILVSISSQTLINEMWSVETTGHKGWMKLTYGEADNSNWKAPYVLGTNVGQPNGWSYREGYGNNTEWLSASADTNMSITTYFRGNLGEYPTFKVY